MGIPFRVRERAIATTPGSLAAVNDAHTVECEGAASVTFVVDSVNAANGIVLTFEGQLTNSGPWVVLAAQATNSTNHTTKLAATAAISTLPTFGWIVPVFGYRKVRARVSARTGGSLTMSSALSHVPM